MDDTNALSQRQQQQQQMILQQQQQQQMLMLQLQHQKQQAMSRFPSNIDAHLRTPGIHRPLPNPNFHQQLNPNPNPNLGVGVQNQNQNQQQIDGGNSQQRMVQTPTVQTEVQFAYQDAWRVCHPDYRRPFASIEDACERLLPYHVVADYEAEEEDRILDSDTTGQMMSRSQQWDNNISAKVAEFTGTFEKQVYAYNLISRKRELGEFRAEERLMIEQALLQEEKRAMLELKNELETREKAGMEARMRMTAMTQASQSQSHAHAEMLARGAIRTNALGSHSHDVSKGDQEHGGNPDGMMNGWGHNAHRDDEPGEDFLNDEENDHGEAETQDDEWKETGEFDLNTR